MGPRLRGDDAVNGNTFSDKLNFIEADRQDNGAAAIAHSRMTRRIRKRAGIDADLT
jgi:hypothetical protein